MYTHLCYVVICFKKCNGKHREKGMKKHTFMASKENENCYKEKNLFFFSHTRLLKTNPSILLLRIQRFQHDVGSNETLNI